jgi:hypothetical protein
MQNKLLRDVLKLLRTMGTMRYLDTMAVRTMIERVEKVIDSNGKS